MRTYLDTYLQYILESSDGDTLRSALESVIDEEKMAINLFKIQINHCREQIENINAKVGATNPTQGLLVIKKAFEEQELILNIGAQV